MTRIESKNQIPQIMKHKHKNIYGIFQHKKSADAKKQKKRKSLPGDYKEKQKFYQLILKNCLHINSFFFNFLFKLE